MNISRVLAISLVFGTVGAFMLGGSNSSLALTGKSASKGAQTVIASEDVSLIPDLSVEFDAIRDRKGREWDYWTYYPQMHYTKHLEQACPKIADVINDFNGSARKAAQEFTQNAAKELPEMRRENPEAPSYATHHEQSCDVAVHRCDRRVFSAEMCDYTYCGGVHGLETSTGYNYDMATGQHLKLSDIVSDIPALQKKITSVLLSSAPEETFEDSVHSCILGARQNDCWVVTDQGLLFCFNPYEIACYASGSFRVNICFSDNPELFKPEWRDAFPVAGRSSANGNAVKIMNSPLYRQLQGKWKLVEVESEGRRVSAAKLKQKMTWTFDGDSLAAFSSQRGSQNPYEREFLRVKVLKKDASFGQGGTDAGNSASTPREKWGAQIFGDSERDYHLSVFPDGKMHMRMHTYVKGQSKPVVFLGVFEREK